MKLVTTTTRTVYGIPECPDGLELPYTPCEDADPVAHDDRLNYLIHDEFPSEWEWPEGVVFADGNVVGGAEGLNSLLAEVDQTEDEVFAVGKYEHGLVSFCLHGERSYADMQWDYGCCGFISIPRSWGNAKEAAEALLDEYTKWCNGEVYMAVSVPFDSSADYEVLGGLIGLEYAEQVISEGEL